MVLTTYRGKTGMEPLTPAANVHDFYQWAGLEPGSNVLDIGCGNGRNYMALHDKGCEVYGLDISEEALEEARKKSDDTGFPVRLVRGDIGALPFRECSFDAIYANAMDPKITAGKWKDSLRALKKGGKFYVNIMQKVEVINSEYGKHSFEVPVEEIESWFGKGDPGYRVESKKEEDPTPAFREINGNQVYQMVTSLLVKIEKLA